MSASEQLKSTKFEIIARSKFEISFVWKYSCGEQMPEFHAASAFGRSFGSVGEPAQRWLLLGSFATGYALPVLSEAVISRMRTRVHKKQTRDTWHSLIGW